MLQGYVGVLLDRRITVQKLSELRSSFPAEDTRRKTPIHTSQSQRQDTQSNNTSKDRSPWGSHHDGLLP